MIITEEINNTRTTAFVTPQTVEDVLAYYGVLDDMANLIVDGSNVAQRIAAKVFHKNFTTCLDIEFSELEDSWKPTALCL